MELRTDMGMATHVFFLRGFIPLPRGPLTSPRTASFMLLKNKTGTDRNVRSFPSRTLLRENKTSFSMTKSNVDSVTVLSEVDPSP